MRLIDQEWFWLDKPEHPEELIEIAGRTCYKSTDKMTPDSANKFVKMLIKNGHHAMLEHANATVKFITNRGVSHELVRHRIAAYAQESTRYVNYGKKEMEFIRPVWMPLGEVTTYNDSASIFRDACTDAEAYYDELLDLGWKPEQAREVLPNAIKTEIVVTANFREWRHIFTLRTSPKAHPQMRALMLDCFENGFLKEYPILFEDLLKERL